MIMNYTLSSITNTEFPQLMHIWENSVRATHHFLSEEDLLFYKELIPSYFGAVRLTAVRDLSNTIIGFMGTSSDSIEMLFIDPTHRRKGIGKLLVSFALENLNLNKVDVNEQNEQALAFYLSQGFEVINRSNLDGSGKPYPIFHLSRITK